MTSKPKPIRDFPHQGQLQVVASFRAAPAPGVTRAAFERVMAAHIRELRHAAVVAVLADLDVAVRVIGADGERSEIEGGTP